MPDHPEWPPTARGLYAGARCLAYLMVAVAGLDVAFGDLGRTGESTSHLWIDIIGLLAATSGAAALIGTVFRRWQVEWLSVAMLTSALGLYTILDWYVLLFIIGYPPVTIGALAIGAGIAVVAAVATGRRQWRWAGLVAAAVVLALAVQIDARNPAIVTAAAAFAAGRWVELWLFSDTAVRARRMRPGAAPEIDP